uniref:G-protein coupled receptors family 1 profile domain-containing protein n=1 Tax=Plectus sambesii TaxID=2011161 RepID=A0A914X6J3_9BILA
MVQSNYSYLNATTGSTGNSNIIDAAFSFIILALGFLAVFGNGFILLVIGNYKTLRSNLCNALIGLLAIADFASGIGLLIRGISNQIFEFTGYHDYTNIDCLLLGIVGIYSVHMSQMITIFIAVDRLKAVRDPFKYATQDNLKSSLTALIVSIGYSLFGAVIAFIGLDYNFRPEICATGSSVPTFYPPYWSLFTFIAAIIVFYSYARTALLLKKKLRNVKSSIEKKHLKRQKEVFKAINIVLIVYAFCWCLPTFLTVGATIAQADAVIMGHLSSIIAVGTGINSSGNLFIYAWKHHEIGEHMRKFLNLKVNASSRRSISTTHFEKPAATTGKQLAFATVAVKVT